MMKAFAKTRRDFIKESMYFGIAAVAAGPAGKLLALSPAVSGSRMKFGLVTYQWGKD